MVTRFNKFTPFFLKILILLIFFIDIISYNSSVTKYGMFLWIISFIFFFVFAAKVLFEDLLNFKNLFTTLVTFILITVVFTNTVSSKNLSGETTQEINCFLNHWQLSTDRGFKQTCLFGYPARQFFLPALPSLIFGRSQFSLNFGGSLYFFLGIIIFAGGLLKYLEETGHKDILTALIISFIPHIYFFNSQMFMYEQSIYPFSLSLILSGLFLFFIYRPTKVKIYLMGLTVYYLIFSYTTSLALVFLSLLTGIFLIFNKTLSLALKKTMMMVIIVILFSLFFSFNIRHDLKITGEEFSVKIITTNLIRILNHLFFSTEGKPLISPIFSPVFLFVSSFCLIEIKRVELFILACWSWLVIVFATISKGYTYYGLDYRLFRTLIIFPVIFLIIARLIKENIDSKIKKTNLIYFIFIFFLITGWVYQFNYLKTKEISRHLAIIRWLDNKIKKNQLNERGHIYISSEMMAEYISLNDSLQYFFPHMTYSILDKNCSNVDLSKNNTLFLLSQADKEKLCFSLIDPLHKPLDHYVFFKDKELYLYKR